LKVCFLLLLPRLVLSKDNCDSIHTNKKNRNFTVIVGISQYCEEWEASNSTFHEIFSLLFSKG